MSIDVLILLISFIFVSFICGRKKREKIPPGANTTIVPPVGTAINNSKEVCSKASAEGKKTEGNVVGPLKKPTEFKVGGTTTTEEAPVGATDENGKPGEEKKEKTVEEGKKNKTKDEKGQDGVKKEIAEDPTQEGKGKETTDKQTDKTTEKTKDKETDKLTIDRTQPDMTKTEDSTQPMEETVDEKKLTVEKTQLEITDEKKTEEKTEEKQLKPHIIIEPTEQLDFQADQEETKKLSMKNGHDKKVMFKVKTSDNVIYRVCPVFGTIEPGETVELSVTHTKAPAKDDKLVIVNSEFIGDEKDLAKSFKTGKQVTGGQLTVKIQIRPPV